MRGGRRRRARGRRLAVILVAASVAMACNAVLGIDEQPLRPPPDAEVDAGSEADAGPFAPGPADAGPVDADGDAACAKDATCDASDR